MDQNRMFVKKRIKNRGKIINKKTQRKKSENVAKRIEKFQYRCFFSRPAPSLLSPSPFILNSKANFDFEGL